MKHRGLKKFIGNREFYKLIWVVALPLMLQQLASNSVNLLDNVMIGQLGDAALAGVAAVNRFYMISIFGSNGVLAAAAIYIAQFYGAQDEEHMKQSFRFSLIAAYIFAVVSFILGITIPEIIVEFFTDDAAVVAIGSAYMKVASWTFLTMALSMAIGSAMRAIGESRIPLRISVLAVCINGVLNYIFIFGHLGLPAMGVMGAAYATVIARLVEAILYTVVLMRIGYPFITRLWDVFRMSKRLIRAIIVKASPLALNEILWSCGMAVLFKFYATRGSDVLSAYSIASTTGDLFFVLFSGMAVASTVLISQPLGANKLEEARNNAYQMLGFSILLSLGFAVLMFGTSFIVPDFYNISVEANHLAGSILRIMSAFFWVYTANTECYFILRAGGDTRSTLIMDSVYMWFVNLPLVGFFCYFTDISMIGLYVIGQMTDIVKLVFSYWLVSKERWVTNLTEVVISEPELLSPENDL